MHRLFIAAIVVLASCKSRSRYADVPGRANATITAVRQSVATLFDHDVASKPDDAVVSACVTSIDRLEPMRDVDFEDRSIALPAHAPLVHEVVATLLDHRSVRCPEHPNGAELRDCRAWCIERWSMLAATIERVRAAASRDGIAIEPLASAPPK